MSLPVQCPHCKHCFSVGDDMLGQRIKCMKCPGTFAVPASQFEADALRGRYPMPPPRVSATGAVPQAPLAPPKSLAAEPILAEVVPDAIPWALPVDRPTSPGTQSRWAADDAEEPEQQNGKLRRSTGARLGGWFLVAMAIVAAVLRLVSLLNEPRGDRVATEHAENPPAFSEPAGQLPAAESRFGETAPPKPSDGADEDSVARAGHGGASPAPGEKGATADAASGAPAAEISMPQRLAATAWTNWIWSAERLGDKLATISEGTRAGGAEFKVASHLASALADQTRTLVPANPVASSTPPPALDSLCPTRERRSRA